LFWVFLILLLSLIKDEKFICILSEKITTKSLCDDGSWLFYYLLKAFIV